MKKPKIMNTSPTERIPERIHSIASNLGALFAVFFHGFVEEKFWTKKLHTYLLGNEGTVVKLLKT